MSKTIMVSDETWEMLREEKAKFQELIDDHWDEGEPHRRATFDNAIWVLYQYQEQLKHEEAFSNYVLNHPPGHCKCDDCRQARYEEGMYESAEEDWE